MFDVERQCAHAALVGCLFAGACGYRRRPRLSATPAAIGDACDVGAFEVQP